MKPRTGAPTAEEWQRWNRPRYFAGMRWCGDEVCDCHQPQIDLVTPNLTVGYPWVRRTRIWEGTFQSDGGSPEQRNELSEACQRMGIPEGESFANDQPYSVAKDVDALEMAIGHAEGAKPNALFRGGPLDGRALAVGEPPPPDWHAPVPPEGIKFMDADKLPAPSDGPRIARYRVRTRRPLVYECLVYERGR